MNDHLFLSFLLSCFNFSFLNAQSGDYQVGPSGAGMGYTNATISDAWLMFNNVGGLGKDQSFRAGFLFENSFLLEGLNRMGLTLIFPFSWGNIGGSIYRFGDDLYNEQVLSLGYGNQLGIASLGIRLNYLQYYIETLGSKGTLILDFGGIAQISDKFYFGAYVVNISQGKIDEAEPLPTILRAGVSYRPLEHIAVNIEAEKDIDYKPRIKWGFSYEFFEKLTVRTGLNTNPFASFFGLGFAASKISVDYAFSHHPPLGYSHQLGAIYLIKSKG